MGNLVKVEYLVPSSDVDVHNVAHAIVSETMAAGQASNGIGSFWNKTPLYHLWKALHHLLRAWHMQDPEAREEDNPRLRHTFNAATRLVLMECVRLKNAEPAKEALVESVDE